MKLFLTFIVLVFSLYIIYAQDTTSTKRNPPNPPGIFFEYGIDNNNWSALNQILVSNGYNGNFNAISYARWGEGFIFRKRKRSDIEFNPCISGQSFTASNRSYDCRLYSLKLLGHYNFYNQHRIIASIASGLNLQGIDFRIDTLYNSSQFVNYNSSALGKDLLFIPLIVDIKFCTSEKEKLKRKSSSGLFVGLRATYNFNIYQSDWYRYHNDQYIGYPNIVNPSYFEATLLFGIY